MLVAGKVALITGAAGEIGAAIARQLMEGGARVALADKNIEGLREIAGGIGGDATCHECDVSDEQSMKLTVEAAEMAHGRLDIGVLNAGISAPRTPLEEVDVTTYDRIMAVNARGVFLGLKHLFPALKRQGGGSIVVTASTEGLRGNAGLAAYAASKHAAVALSKTAAIEWAQHNIRVNCINPGPVDTAMIRALEQASRQAGTADVRERGVSIIPMKRFATAEEIAKFVRFLTSDDASYSTGATYLLDGGMLAGKMALDKF
ncbi:SDR family NAD(P)-dependent oxidoreductase [Sphingorhabdus sp.]|jgi:NAD(P)-dependent dehydrogenase (short-subunit alcohol dehydrogenase family)|uniref:SDR family NAD(P)-dependent oxidoreductase n=1 Tax=Sphingorhabdus sp. TaxID=1902408 RepID=UPI0037CCA9D6